jgi:hypothetical protein
VAGRLADLRRRGRIRLDDIEADAIAAALDGIEAAGVDLFGSRTDPGGRGGDIDLLILTTAAPLEVARQVGCRFFARCEERLDVVVVHPERPTPAQRAFLETLDRVPIV